MISRVLSGREWLFSLVIQALGRILVYIRTLGQNALIEGLD